MKKFCILAMLALAGLSACNKMLDEVAPRHAITTDKVGESDLNKLTNGVLYTMEGFVNAGWFDGDLMGENFHNGPGGGKFEDVTLMTPSTLKVEQRWKNAFTSLRQVNELIASASAASASASAENALKTGHFCRALIYFGITTRWNAAPLLRKTTNEEVPLSQEAQLYAFMEEDLNEALRHPASRSGFFYVTDDAVNALLAKVYLWEGKKAEAAEAAKKVIDAGSYALEGTSESLAKTWCFGTASKEIVFALANQRTDSQITLHTSVNDTDGSWNYRIPYPTAETPDTEDLFTSLFADVPGLKEGDIRKPVVESEAARSRILKFPNGNDEMDQFVKNDDPMQSPLVVIRIAEMYLTRAEALGNTPEGHAVLESFLQKRYRSVSLPATLTDSAWSDLLLDEYRREFYAEGHRWFDIKRLGRTDALKTLAGRTYLMRWPIPQGQIDLLKEKGAYPQNPGYPVTNS